MGKIKTDALFVEMTRLEKLTALWWIFTTILALLLEPYIPEANQCMFFKQHCAIVLICLSGFVFGKWLQSKKYSVTLGRFQVSSSDLGELVRMTPLGMLAFWYSDTYVICSTHPYLDHLFAMADQWLFGYQPSIVFSEFVTNKVISDLIYMGYYSYFWLQLLVVLYYFFRHRDEVERVTTTILASFFIFYLIYFALPVAGPQYYFQAIGMDAARVADFAEVGTFFATNTERLTFPGWTDGFFYQTMNDISETGEFPTAAFPSSHIGCTVVFLMLALRRSKILFCVMLPFTVFLSAATVYIRAHYFVDTVAGIMCGLAVYYLLRHFLLDRCNKEDRCQ